MKKVLFLIIFGLLACSEQPMLDKSQEDEYASEPIIKKTSEADPTKIDSSQTTTESPKESIFSHRVIFTENIGWGYQIFEGNTLLLKQEYIPAIQGNHAFESKISAEKTAKYILKKVENGTFPPTLSVKELDSLGVLPPDYKH